MSKVVEKKINKLNDQVNRLTMQLHWYKSFFDNATDAIFLIQPETWSVLDINDFAANLLEATKEELIGTSIMQFRRIYKLLKKSNSDLVLSELNLITSNDNEVMLEVSARFVNFKGEKLIQAIARDISEQKNLTDKLVQADKLVLLGQLSAGVAHEIRNPLAAVTLNLQILKRNVEKSSSYFSYIDTALQGAERITRIVDLTLNFSRPAQLDIKELDLNSLIPSTLDLASASFKRKDIRIDLKLSEKLPKVMADSKQIQQVLINLFTNGADAIKDSGQLNIRTYTEKQGNSLNKDRYVVLSISDNGTGISPEDLSKIFNPFFTRKPEGTGLGLPITQRILHQHNGIIDVESKINEGTTFYVKLPVIKKE